MSNHSFQLFDELNSIKISILKIFWFICLGCRKKKTSITLSNRKASDHNHCTSKQVESLTMDLIDFKITGSSKNEYISKNQKWIQLFKANQEHAFKIKNQDDEIAILKKELVKLKAAFEVKDMKSKTNE